MLFKVEHRIGINARVDDVWDVLADISKWSEWSPIHNVAEGEMRFGAPVHLEEHYQGLGTWEVRGTIDDWMPLSHIHIHVPKPFWAGTLVRYVELIELSPQSTSVAFGAAFGGFFSVREGKRFKKHIRAGFEAMNEALKAKMES